jgi:hypothetical protein
VAGEEIEALGASASVTISDAWAMVPSLLVAVAVIVFCPNVTGTDAVQFLPESVAATPLTVTLLTPPRAIAVPMTAITFPPTTAPLAGEEIPTESPGSAVTRYRTTASDGTFALMSPVVAVVALVHWSTSLYEAAGGRPTAPAVVEI